MIALSYAVHMIREIPRGEDVKVGAHHDKVLRVQYCSLAVEHTLAEVYLVSHPGEPMNEIPGLSKLGRLVKDQTASASDSVERLATLIAGLIASHDNYLKRMFNDFRYEMRYLALMSIPLDQQAVEHHTDYPNDLMVLLCTQCHGLVHQRKLEPKYDVLLPRDTRREAHPGLSSLIIEALRRKGAGP